LNVHNINGHPLSNQLMHWSEFDTKEAALANQIVNLIAAAPRLLEACKSGDVAWRCHLCGYLGDLSVGQCLCPACSKSVLALVYVLDANRVDAAIADATGGKQ